MRPTARGDGHGQGAQDVGPPSRLASESPPTPRAKSLEGEYYKTLADVSTKNLFMALKTAFKAEDVTEVIARDVPEFFWGPQRSPPAATRASTAESTQKDIAGEGAKSSFTFGRKIF